MLFVLGCKEVEIRKINRVNKPQITPMKPSDPKVITYTQKEDINEKDIHSLCGKKLVDLKYNYWYFDDNVSSLMDIISDPSSPKKYNGMIQVPTKQGTDYRFIVKDGIISKSINKSGEPTTDVPAK
jgi:hypothetical protein